MGIDDRLEGLFRDVLGPQVSGLRDDDSTETIEGWDSANHLGLMLALEAEFDLQLDVDEMAGLTTVAAIRERVRSSAGPGAGLPSASD
jgi:acyl carrier protein